MTPIDDSDLFDSPRLKPSNKIVYQPAGAQWSLNRLPEVQSLYQSSFNKPLPLANKGQGSIHNKWGYDHRDSADVSINPSTPEGQQFVEKLKQANVPFLAFTGVVPGVATGPHIHLGFPSHRTQQKFGVGTQKKSKRVASDDLFDTDDDLFDSRQTPPAQSQNVSNQSPNGLPPSAGPSSEPSVPIEQALVNLTRQTNRRIAPLMRQAAQQPQQPATGSSGIGELRRADDPEVARIQRLQTEEAVRAANPTTMDYIGIPSAQRQTRVAQRAARRASEEQATEVQRQREQPQLDALTQRYRQEIREIGLPQWMTEVLSRGGAGVGEAIASTGKALAPYTYDPQKSKERVEALRLDAEAMQRAATAEGADRNVVSRFAQDVASGLISSTPELAAISAGVSPIATFGIGSGLRTYGRGGNTQQVLKEAAKGATTGAAFELPVPSVITNPLARSATKGALVGGATTGVELASGTTPQQAVASGLTNAAFGAYGELSRSTPREKLPYQTEASKTASPSETPAERVQRENYNQMAGPQFINHLWTESVGGNAGPDRAGVNMTVDREGRILRVTNDPIANEDQGRLFNIAAVVHWPEGLTGKAAPVIEQVVGPEPMRSIVERSIPKVWGGPPTEGEGGQRGTQSEIQPDVTQEREAVEPAAGSTPVRATEPQESVVSPIAPEQRASVAERQRFYHRDYGEVSESPNQRRVGRGRVRVVAEDGSEHVIKRAALTGAGNQRAVPIRSEPATLEARNPDEDLFEPNIEGASESSASPEAAPAKPERVVYHSGATPLDRIDINRVMVGSKGRGLYFATTPEGTLQYEAAKGRPETYANLKSATLDMEHPLDVTQPEAVARFVDKLDTLSRSDSELAKAAQLTKRLGRIEDPTTLRQHIRSVVDAAREQPNADYVRSIVRDNPQLTALAKSLGYDGIIDSNEQVVFDHSQIREVKGRPGSSTAQPREPSTTAVKNAAMAEDRAARDLPELVAAEPRRATEVHQRALDANAKDPRSVDRLVTQALETDKNLTDVETAQLRLRAQEIKNREGGLLKEINSAADPQTISEKRAELDSLTDEFDRLSQATKKSGTEWGRAGVARQQAIDQDFSLVAMKARLKAAKGDVLSDTENTKVEELHARLAKAEADLADANEKLAQRDLQRFVDRAARKRQRTETRQSLDAEFADLITEFGKARKEIRGVQASGLAGIDPEGKLAALIGKMAHNRVKAGLTDAAQLVDDIHAVISKHLEGVTKRDIRDAISGYGLEPKGDRRSADAKQLVDIRTELKRLSTEEDIAAGKRLSTKDRTRQAQLRKQEAELQRRMTQRDYVPATKPAPPTYAPETHQLQEQVARVKRDYERSLRQYELQNRSKPEKAADFLIRWGRAAKLSYVSTLGKLSSAATGRMVMSPLENLIGEIPHRLLPELSKRATTEGGGFNRAAEVAALWKSGRFRQVLNHLTRGSSDLDVLYGKGLDKELQSEGVLGVPGRVHGALKEYPRQAEFDRAFVKVLRNYDQSGRDIADPAVQLAARMEAYNSAERARFQQRNFISDTFNDAMNALERKGLAGKVVAKTGRFIFPITRVPVNVAGETLNYAFGSVRAPLETAIRGGVKNLTAEQANNIMRAYKKGGLGLAVMTYAFLNPQQFGGYYQRGDSRDENEPKPGEVVFFGVRVPKALTHVPILEAGQLAATIRRVMDKLTTKGESKSDAVAGGVTAGAKGVASGIPFYETPARFFSGQEGPRGAAQIAGEQVRGMIPGFVQEGAQLLDRDAQGKPIHRTPAGSAPQRFGQTIELGIPGLRRRVPESKGQRTGKRDELIRQSRSGQLSDADLGDMARQGEITEANRKSIARTAKLSERQARFSNYVPSTALDRFERMDAGQQEEVRDIMQRKAYTLLHSDALTEAQKEEFAARIDAAGLTPIAPSRTRAPGGFKSVFR